MTTKSTKTDDTTAALAQLIEASKSARLTQEQEASATSLVRELLQGAKAKVTTAVDAMMSLPWVIAVDATVAAWPELKPAGRKNFLASLAAQQTEQGRRVRLSLGRALLPLDAAVTLKLVQEVCAEMAAADGGPTQKDRQAFANVLLGKGKPWLLHLPLADIQDPAPVIRCALLTSCTQQCPPLTQLSVVRWIAGAGTGLAQLPEDLLELIAQSAKRWHGKLQAEFRKDVPGLPPVIEAVLKSQPHPAQPQKQERQQQQPRHPQEPGDDDASPGDTSAQEEPQNQQHANPRHAKRQERQDRQERQQSSGRQQQGGSFDLGAALRQIESHVQSLRTELHQAKTQAQAGTREPRGRGGRDRRHRGAEAPAPEPGEIDELKRHNDQLADTITELRAQLEDLAADHEDIATSMEAHGAAPLAEGKEQLLSLLGIKLQEAYTDYLKLGKEPPDEVFCKHYQFLLEHVFEELTKQGVVLKAG